MLIVAQKNFRWRYLFVMILVGALALLFTAIEPDRSRGELVHWQNEQSRFLSVGDAEVHYRREGNPDGPTIVLLHGTAASLHTWDAWVEILGDDYSIVRFDLPGFGLTGPHPDNDYSIDAYVAMVDGVVRELGLDRFALAGNSLGGNIAWQYALAHPQKLAAMALLDPSGFPSDGPKPIVFRLASIPLLNKLLTLFGPRWLIESSLLEVYADDTLVTPALIDRYHELALYEGNRDAFVQRTVQWEAAPVARLGEITTPTLILWGEEDRWIPVGDAARFAAAITGAELITYPDVGHLPMEENAARSARDLDQFLRATLPAN